MAAKAAGRGTGGTAKLVRSILLLGHLFRHRFDLAATVYQSSTAFAHKFQYLVLSGLIKGNVLRSPYYYSLPNQHPGAMRQSMSHSKGEHCSACIELHIQETHTKSVVKEAHNTTIRHLPVELLSNIFMLSDPYPVETEEFPHPLLNASWTATGKYQFSLGAVCRAWRNIVWSTPHLWTNIRIWLQIKDVHCHMEFLLLYLRLSGSLPLDIHAWVPQYSDLTERDYPVLLPLLEALSGHSERWRSLDLHIPPRLLSHMKVPSGAPNLEILRIYYFGGPQEQNPTAFRISFGLTSPRMVVAYSISFSTIWIDWTNVTSAKFNTFNMRECLELFRQATRLVNLQVDFLGTGGIDLSTLREVVTAPSLALWVAGFTRNPGPFLQNLVLSSIVNFWLQGCGPSGALKHLFLRSKCPLRTLTFSGANFTGLDVIPILRTTPSSRILSSTMLPFAALDLRNYLNY